MGSHRAKLVAALLSLYVVWGSTYVAIAIAVRTIPPLLMGGVRFTVAALLLFAWLRARREPAPTAAEWRGASIIGALLLLGGNGLVVLSANRIPSSVIALVIALTPLFVAVLPWLAGIASRSRDARAARPTLRVATALATGLSGVALLVRAPASGLAADPAALAMVLGAVLSWSAGTILARKLPLPASPVTSTAAQMLAGGLLLTAAGALRGEVVRVDFAAMSAASVAAVAYLIVFGSIVGFGSFQWLLRNTPPTLATSYAYVNPLVALVLGHLLDGDPLGPDVLLPSALIVGAVALLLRAGAPRPGAG